MPFGLENRAGKEAGYEKEQQLQLLSRLRAGGGLFLLVYLVLVLTFGFVLLTTDVAIGRRTRQNALRAFGTPNKKWNFLGVLTFLVPALIMAYYSVIGGWIMKYFAVYLVSDGT